jgi:hypothetical protein
MKRIILVAVILMSTLVCADVLRIRDTGEIIAIGHGRILSRLNSSQYIEWTDCNGHKQNFEALIDYQIVEGHNCKDNNHEPHIAEPPGDGGRIANQGNQRHK